MEFDVKEIAKELSPIVDEAIKASNEESKKEFNETLESLKKDIADVKVMSKKVSGADRTEARENLWKFFRAFIKWNFEEVKTLSEWTDTDWGYLVPSEFHKEVVRVAELSGFARRYCSIFPMWTDTKDMTTLASGATAYIVWESSAITASTPQFGRKQLVAKKFGCLVKSTHELIDDNMTNEDILTLVAKLCAEALAELEDAQVLTGSWAGDNMTWVMVDPNVNVVTMNAWDTSFEDISYSYLVDVKNAVPAKYKKAWKKISWQMSQDIFNIIEKIVDTTWRPIMRESVTTADNFTLLGYPVEITEVMPVIWDDAVSTKVLSFGVYDFFAIGDRKTITAEQGYASWDFEKQIKSLVVTERVAWIILIPAAFAVLKTAAA